MHKPTAKTRGQVIDLARIGTPQETIALVLDINRETLTKYYRDELDLSKVQADAQVVSSLFQNAISGNVAAQIFWCKTRLGWEETQVVESREFAVLVEGPELTEEEWLNESLGSHKPDRKPH